jgi:hypothetical protein
VNAFDLSIDVPLSAPHATNSVVVIESDGATEADSVRLLQPSVPVDTLHVFDAQLTGDGLRFGAGKTKDAYVRGFSNTGQSIAWPARLNQSASFEVEFTYDANASSDGQPFTVKLGPKVLKGTIQPGTRETISLGRVFLKKGDATITLTLDENLEKAAILPRSIRLKPVK